MGRLHPVKGLMNLVEAIHRVRPRGLGLRLGRAGYGRLSSRALSEKSATIGIGGLV